MSTTADRSASRLLGVLAGNVGRGLIAGVVGTAAMTVSSTLESKLRRRDVSTAPSQVASKVLGVAPVDDRGEHRFNQLAHWAYGTGWGAVRGLLGAAGLRPAPAVVAHLSTVWGTEQVMLPAVDVAPPATEWEPAEVLIDLFHHTVYATVTGVVYQWLTGR